MFGWFHSIEEFTFEWNLRIVLIFSFRGFQLNLYRIGKNLPIIQTMSEIWTGWWATTQHFDRLFLKKIRYSSRWWYSIIARWIFLCVHEQALTQSKGENPSIKKRVFFFSFLVVWNENWKIERLAVVRAKFISNVGFFIFKFIWQRRLHFFKSMMGDGHSRASLTFTFFIIRALRISFNIWPYFDWARVKANPKIRLYAAELARERNRLTNRGKKSHRVASVGAIIGRLSCVSLLLAHTVSAGWLNTRRVLLNAFSLFSWMNTVLGICCVCHTRTSNGILTQ